MTSPNHSVPCQIPGGWSKDRPTRRFLGCPTVSSLVFERVVFRRDCYNDAIMSLGDRLGIAGLVVALLGIGITILWPEKKWVGWLCLGVAGLLILLWVLAEFRVLLDIIRRYPKPIGATALIIGMSIFGIFAWLKWISNPSVPQIAKQNKPKGEEPKTEPLNMNESSKPRPL